MSDVILVNPCIQHPRFSIHAQGVNFLQAIPPGAHGKGATAPDLPRWTDVEHMVKGGGCVSFSRNFLHLVDG